MPTRPGTQQPAARSRRPLALASGVMGTSTQWPGRSPRRTRGTLQATHTCLLSVPVLPPNCSLKWQKPGTREAFDLRENSKCSPLAQGHRQATHKPLTVVTENGPTPGFFRTRPYSSSIRKEPRFRCGIRSRRSFPFIFRAIEVARYGFFWDAKNTPRLS